MIKNLLVYSLFLLVFTACGDRCNVVGNSTVHSLEGKMLYLKALVGEKLECIDSCRVVHGKFSFNGTVDSTVMANLFLEEESVMPLVLENSPLTIKIDQRTQHVEGSPLNEALYDFIKKKSHIDSKMAELPRKESRMIMDGIDHDVIVQRLSGELDNLVEESDELVSDFISENYDNVLGPGVFMIITGGYPYPVLTPLIEEILSDATPAFLSHPYVDEYMDVAKENMEQMRAEED